MNNPTGFPPTCCEIHSTERLDHPRTKDLNDSFWTPGDPTLAETKIRARRGCLICDMVVQALTKVEVNSSGGEFLDSDVCWKLSHCRSGGWDDNDICLKVFRGIEGRQSLKAYPFDRTFDLYIGEGLSQI
jgi:hypothetical protein